MPSTLRTAGDVDFYAARRWLGLAVLVLILAGLLALLLVLGRMPPFDRLVTDPQWFRRALVVHVDLSLVVWFYSFAAALLFALPARRRARWLGTASVHLGAAGVVLLVAAAWLPGTRPVMSNYLPMVDHWLFGAGLCTFGAGVLAVVLSRRLLPDGAEAPWLPVPAGALPGLQALALALVLACLTFASSALAMPAGLDAEAHYELLMWGGGHVLQLCSVIAMLCAWLILAGSLLGRSPLSRPLASALFAALCLPWAVAPLLPLGGTWTATYRQGFTTLMQFGLFPVVTVVLLLGAGALRRARASGAIGPLSLRDPRWSGLLASAVLTVIGFVLGALIRGSNTVVPAHYHASIGAVTVAFMAVAYTLLDALGMKVPDGRLGRAAGWQPLLYGAGQTVFALGFAMAGAGGMARKVYGQEQAARGALETSGLVVMGVGGFVAVAGGVLFLGILAAAWQRRSANVPSIRTTLTEGWRYPWLPSPSTRSRS